MSIHFHAVISPLCLPKRLLLHHLVCLPSTQEQNSFYILIPLFRTLRFPLFFFTFNRSRPPRPSLNQNHHRRKHTPSNENRLESRSVSLDRHHSLFPLQSSHQSRTTQEPLNQIPSFHSPFFEAALETRLQHTAKYSTCSSHSNAARESAECHQHSSANDVGIRKR